VLAAPIIVLVAIAIKLTSPGSIFFKQVRIGLNGRMFELYKFRTMIEDAHQRLDEVFHLNEMTGPVFKAKDDPRVTAVGRVLRRAAPADPRGSVGLSPVASPPAVDEAWSDVPLADQASSTAGGDATGCR